MKRKLLTMLLALAMVFAYSLPVFNTDTVANAATSKTQAEAIAWAQSKVGTKIDTDGEPAGHLRVVEDELLQLLAVLPRLARGLARDLYLRDHCADDCRHHAADEGRRDGPDVRRYHRLSFRPCYAARIIFLTTAYGCMMSIDELPPFAPELKAALSAVLPDAPPEVLFDGPADVLLDGPPDVLLPPPVGT